MAGDIPASPPGPRLDEIALAAPASGALCHSLACANRRKLAVAVVTFGQLGGDWWGKDALWPDCWGRSFPCCGGCWDRTRQIAEKHRPGLVVRDCRPRGPAAGEGGM